MSATLTASLSPGSSPDTAQRAELSAIDASTKLPALFFLGSSILWLLAGTVFALIASFKLHSPEFLGDVEWLTFGRSRALHLNAVIYGWAVNASFAVSLWLMARLSRAELRHPGLLLVAAVFWNIGVTVGMVGIALGHSTSIEWLEFPAYATPILFFAYALVGAWAVITFRFGRAKHIYVSQWYLLAALFWFPWLYSVAQVMLVIDATATRGTVQALVNWWFAHNVLGLWFTPIGLAAIYYFLPKVLGKPINSYYLSVLGFWSLAIFYNWAGVHHLIGGPVPVWVQTAGIAASFMMVVPVIVTGLNQHLTLVGAASALKYSPTLRFIVFGGVNYTLTSLAGSLMSMRSWAEVTHFTHYTVGHAHHGMYAFFTMVMFGSIYYILPRILLKEWPSAKLISLHFWTTSIGIVLYVLAMSVGGIEQGLKMNVLPVGPDGQPGSPVAFLEVVAATIKWLELRSYSGVLITIGHVAFAINFAWMLAQPRKAGATTPTLFRPAPDLEVAR
jgi:cytochrome c oxidase cbb3-type subunit 1